MKTLLLVSLFILGACANAPHIDTIDSREEKTVDSQRRIEEVLDVTTRSLDDSEKDKLYVTNYKTYLQSVNGIFIKRNRPQLQFNEYLNSLKTQALDLERMSLKVADKYKKEKKKKANLESEEFQLYKTNIMTKYHDELQKKREEKLQKELDPETFAMLIENNKQHSNLFPL